MSTDGEFKSKVLDTDEKFSYMFTEAGILHDSSKDDWEVSCSET